MSKTKSGLENSQGQRLHNFSVQPAPLFDCSWGQEVSTYIEVDSVLFQILAIISYLPSMFVSCLTLMFLWTPYKYLGAAVRPSKVSIFLSLSAQGECPQLELTPVCHCLMLSKRSETGPLSPVSQGLRRGVNHCNGPSGCAALGAPQDVLALLLLPFPAARTLLTHTHLAIYKHLQVLLSRADPKLLHSSQSSPSLYQLGDSLLLALTLGISLFKFSCGSCWLAPPVCLHPSEWPSCPQVCELILWFDFICKLDNCALYSPSPDYWKSEKIIWSQTSRLSQRSSCDYIH